MSGSTSDSSLSADVDSDVYQSDYQVPARMGWRRQVLEGFHWRCLALSVNLMICASLMVWCKTPIYSSRPGEVWRPIEQCRSGLIWIPATIYLLLYMVYIVECMHCRIHRSFKRVHCTKEAYRLMRCWVKARPLVRWRMTCYHYGRHVRHYCSTEGGRELIPQMHYSRLNTYFGEARFHPHDCGYTDRSTRMENLEAFPIIKVDIEKQFTFSCRCSQTAYLTQRKTAYDEHASADDYIEMQETFQLVGIEVPESICIMKDARCMPWYCRKHVYWIFSMLCFSWPLRMLIESRTAYASFMIHKRFGGHCRGTLAHQGLSPSSTISKLSQDIYGIIPSYSQALLMSSYTLNGSKISNLKTNRTAVTKKMDDLSDRNLLKRSDITRSKTTNQLHEPHAPCMIIRSCSVQARASSRVSFDYESDHLIIGAPRKRLSIVNELNTNPFASSLRRHSSLVWYSIKQKVCRAAERKKLYSLRKSKTVNDKISLI